MLTFVDASPHPLKALVWVQHLLGIGHVRRAALIARALAEAGVDVTVASGGFPVAGIDYGAARVVQLPPARAADKSFKLLVDEDGQPLDDAWKERRRATLLSLAVDLDPDILLLETYPFGRRAFRFELIPLLEEVTRAIVAASVRDILVAKDNPAREAEMADIARRHLDLILVHGDPAVVPFDATFPPAPTVADLIRYTGYVAPPRKSSPAAPGSDGTGEVIVSVGGGAVGLPLLHIAMAARPLTSLTTAAWRLLAGPDIAEADFQNLRSTAPPGIIIERARPDFPDLLTRCMLSISQAGYNTLMDLLQARCRAIVVPFAAGNETEQAERARLFEARGLLHAIPEAGLTPERLAEGIAQALAAPPPPPFTPALDGAAVTARLLIEAAQ
jgi:predicted glycosyltransferase